jgi:selenocysteine lyase/cysteine desulfurase
MTRLLNISAATAARLHAELEAGGDPELPGAVRASIGLGTTEADVDALVGALQHIAAPRALAAVA